MDATSRRSGCGAEAGGRADAGLHFCLEAAGHRAVDAFHTAALAEGRNDNGKPCLRQDYGPGYYAAFDIDPDGYRLEVHYHQA
jgi:hypothetical protein